MSEPPKSKSSDSGVDKVVEDKKEVSTIFGYARLYRSCGSSA